MSKKRSLSVFSVLIVIASLFLGALVIGIIARYTQGFTSDFKTFYVEYDKQMITNDTSGINLSDGQALRFDVKYTFDKLIKNQDKSFTVKIVPYVTREYDFDFTVDNQINSFSAIPDLSAAFNLVLHESYFTIDYDKTMPQILQIVYPNQVVTVPKNVNAKLDSYFAIAVTSFNGKTIHIKINGRGIILDNSEVIV